MQSKDYAALGGSVAAVAIAVLAGPLPAVATAGVKELVGYVRAFYEKGGPARDLQRQVERAVRSMVEDSHEFPDPESGRYGDDPRLHHSDPLRKTVEAPARPAEPRLFEVDDHHRDPGVAAPR